MDTWELVDFTSGTNVGYLQLSRNGQRVCDFFPYARGASESWVRAQARLICDTMNGGKQVGEG